jgi:tetratricopeptide (TPR) repeat protein
LALLLATISCGPSRLVERLALTPFENLSGDVSLDWIGAAAPSIIAVEVNGSVKTAPIRVESARDAWAAHATEIAYGYYSRQGTHVRLEMVVQDLASGQTIQTYSAEGPLAAGILPLADSIARAVEPRRTHPLGTTSQDAIEQWGTAMTVADPAARLAAYERALSDDANFGPAYVGWSQALLASGDRAGASKAIEKGRGRGALLDDVSRAQLDLEAAKLNGDPTLRREALVALSRLTQSDAAAVRALAETEWQARHFQTAADLFRKAAARDPGEPALLNTLGYALACTGDLSGAVKTLEEYGRRSGEEANAFDSIGEVNFYLGHFDEAERYFLKAHDTNAAMLGGGDLLKASESRMMTGDLRGADGLFRQYADFRRRFKDPAVELETARWEYLTGRRQQGLSRLETFAGENPGDAGAFAESQLAIWYLDTGQPQRAAEHTARAAEKASSPGAKNLAAACRYLAGADAARESVPNPIAAVALLLAKRFTDAAPVLKQVYEQTNPSFDGQARSFYAWALAETGHAKDAADLVELYPIPGSVGEPLFSSLMFPRFLKVRAAVREAQGRRDEAAACMKLYGQLGGTQ